MNAIEQAAKALRLASSVIAGQPEYRHTQKAITAALARLADEHARLAPGMTDLMVPPETLGAWLDANPLPVPSPDRERLITSLAGLGTELMDAEWDAVELINDTIDALRSPADGWRAGAEAMREVIVTAVDEARWGGPTDLLSVVAAIRALPLPSPPAKEKTP